MADSKILEFDTEDALIVSATNAISKAISQKTCTVFLSGGSTPGPIYQQLSAQKINWENIYITLVDERWVDEDDAGSNARLVKNTLLQNHAAKAHFIPMKSAHVDPEMGKNCVEMAYQQLPKPYFIILGMGEDGHVASWFSSAPEYQNMMSNNNKKLVATLNPKKSDITGSYTQRITITPYVLSQCEKAFLIIKGEKKLNLLKNWLHSGSDLPVTQAMDILKSKLNIYAAS